MPFQWLLALLVVGGRADLIATVSDGRHFRSCSLANCVKWCDNIPCCQSGRWDGKCWLFNHQPPSWPRCTIGVQNRCFFRKLEPIPLKGAPSKLDLGKSRLKICMHVNQITDRELELTTFDYGYSAKKVLRHDVVILAPRMSIERGTQKYIAMYKRFVKEFGHIRMYNNSPTWVQKHGHSGGKGLADLVHQERCHLLYSQKGSSNDDAPSIPEEILKVPWAVHVVTKATAPHGTAYAGITQNVSDHACWRGAVVPYIVYPLKNVWRRFALRSKLRIPGEHILLCRHGSIDSFDIPWVRREIIPLLDRNPTLHFLFVNTDWPSDHTHKRLYVLPAFLDAAGWRRYFDACDGMLHARKEGEDFGLAVGQMSVHNKPVLTCDVCGARQHINALGNKAFRYRDVPTLEKTIRKLLTMGRGNITKSNWEAYGGLDPTQVMKRFNEVFIEPARLYWYRLRKVGITDPFSLPSDKLPPRFNYFWRGSNHWGDLRPTVETMYFLETHLCEQPPHDA